MIDFQVIRGTVMNCQQILQTLLYRLGIHGPPAGKLHPIPKIDLHRSVIHKLIVRCQPGLHFHVVIVFEKSFPHSIAKSAPSGIIVVGIQSRISHLLTVSSCSVDKGFLLFLCKCTDRKSSRCQRSCKYCCNYFFLHPFFPPLFSFGFI